MISLGPVGLHSGPSTVYTLFEYIDIFLNGRPTLAFDVF